MRRGLGPILFVAAIAAACSGSSAPTSPSNRASANAPGGGGSTQSNNATTEITGTVDALPPTTPALTFTTAGQTVRTDTSTVFESGNTVKTFADLKLGMRVEVHGTASGNTINATRVHIEEAAEHPNPEPEPEPQPNPAPNPPAPNPMPPKPPAPGEEAEAEGTLGAMTGTCPAISSAVGTTKFTTTASTRFDDVTCASLKAGMKVEVKGTRNADGSIAATRLKLRS